jgi:hypothetical protein
MRKDNGKRGRGQKKVSAHVASRPFRKCERTTNLCMFSARSAIRNVSL